MIDMSLDLLVFLADSIFICAFILLIIGIFIIFYPLLSGKICSWNPPCNFKDGWSCEQCEFKSVKPNGIIDTILELISFGFINKRGN